MSLSKRGSTCSYLKIMGSSGLRVKASIFRSSLLMKLRLRSLEMTLHMVSKSVLLIQPFPYQSKSQKITLAIDLFFNYFQLMINSMQLSTNTQLSDKASKRAYRRLRIIDELVQTQKIYLASLNLLAQVKKDVKEFIGQRETKQLLNVEQLIGLHEQLLSDLSYPNFVQRIVKYIDFFKMYLVFFQNYQKNVQTFKTFFKKNRKFRQYLLTNQYSPRFEGLTLLDIYAKPFQRPMKYNLLFRDLLDSTQTSSPDYAFIKQAFQKFKKVNKQNNDLFNHITKNLRVAELDQVYGNILNNFAFQGNNPRQVIKQVKLRVFKQDLKQRDCDFIMFNDMLLIDIKQTPSQIIRLSYQTFMTAQDVQDGKVYKNMFRLKFGDRSLTFSTGELDSSKSQKQSIMSLFYASLKTDQNSIKVRVLGSQQLNSVSFDKHTIYIIELKLGNFRQLIFRRFSELNSLQEQLLSKYPSILNRFLFKSVRNSYNSKIIEERKISIECLLHSVLTNKQLLQQQKTFIFQKLGIQQSLLDKLKSFSNYHLQLRDEPLSDKFLKVYFERGRCCWFKPNLVTNYSDYKQSKQLNQVYQLQIQVLSNNKTKVFIYKITRISQVLQQIAEKLKLRSYYDYRICLYASKKQIRIIDPDEFAYSYFTMVKQAERSHSALKKFFFQLELPFLFLKKIFYLPRKIEDIQLNLDQQRRMLLRYQLISQVKRKTYPLDSSAIKSIMSAHILLTAFHNNQFKSAQFQTRFLEEVVPDNLKESRDWSQGVDQFIAQLQSQTEIQSHTEKALTFVILNICRNYEQFGSLFYYVTMTAQAQSVFKEFGFQYESNMWLAISLQGISLLMPKDKKKILTLRYEEIQSLKALSKTLVLKSERVSGQLVLGIQQGFEVSSMMTMYNDLKGVCQ